ncbi:MAG: STAS domain-containing protein [Gammaproteobacteria bacterium]|nr:STAS domain-containing protein [Gammaproteobacteria bacterium]MBU1646149.1 STAS domain-containing protein [Gammaproteobacteria bacterium]MBU1972211.1 STAS domain-containing protein [Gammaproteobacteria bacterium]
MEVNVVSADGNTVLQLRGRFDFNAHREFRQAIDAAVAEPTVKEVRVDLAGVDYLDSSALGMLLMLRDRCKGADKTVSLANCRGAVKQVLDIANFSKLFQIV